MSQLNTLPVPAHFNPARANEVYRVGYQGLATEAAAWRKQHDIRPAASDRKVITLMPIDCQNTFCLPEFELFVGGQSGTGAIDDNVRLTEFIYRNLGVLTKITPTMDTHLLMQIFHSIFWVNEAGENPEPNATVITLDDVKAGTWKVNPAIAHSIARGNYTALQAHAMHYVEKLTDDGKYPLMIWGYHAMLGGIGHALTSIIEEACFFHAVVRHSQTGFETKGGDPLTENYSVLRPEVLTTTGDKVRTQKNAMFIRTLLESDAVIIAGQAKSHCVAWTIADLLDEINAQDPTLAKKVYLLEDCTSPVVIPGVIDFTDQANEAFQRFADAGMHVVQSTDPIGTWPGLNLG